MMEKLGACGLISWLIGLVAAIAAYVASVEAVTWIPALLIAIAIGGFVGLVLSHLFCGSAEAGHGAASHAAASEPKHSALVQEALDEAEAGALDAGAEAAGIDPAKAAADKATVDAAIAAEAAAETGGKVAIKSTLLAGEEELASRKGTWKYEGAGASAPAAATPAAAAAPDYDKDGVHEGEDEGTRPEALSGPRGGEADNLKEIKGIGPKLEILCNELGFYHFDQIANWTADEVAWVDANLKGFKGRVSRDNWVEQAKVLAAGGETEFSKRVDKGEVY
ncbi:hypothetical protein [Marimonas arenosa]|uniref:Uncharacterized protein n=1 Tax=Marimonas arenosa TaxID=1795305 RepID=A0AAE3WEW8_9RHOB|nr:hypothetical protein [Marimonas arenosa]MDQ2091452.1 hypothetical protein [Marimonas arenosa]